MVNRSTGLNRFRHHQGKYLQLGCAGTGARARGVRPHDCARGGKCFISLHQTTNEYTNMKHGHGINLNKLRLAVGHHGYNYGDSARVDLFANKIHAQCSTRTCTAHGAKRAVTSGREACTFGPRSRGACCKGTLPPPLLPPVPRPPNPLQPQSGERSCLVQQSRGVSHSSEL